MSCCCFFFKHNNLLFYYVCYYVKLGSNFKEKNIFFRKTNMINASFSSKIHGRLFDSFFLVIIMFLNFNRLEKKLFKYKISKNYERISNHFSNLSFSMLLIYMNRNRDVIRMVSFEHLLKEIDDFGIYQKVRYLLICLAALLPPIGTIFNLFFFFYQHSRLLIFIKK